MSNSEVIAKDIAKPEQKKGRSHTVLVVQPISSATYRLSSVQLRADDVQSVVHRDSVSAGSATESLRELGYVHGHKAVLVLPRHLAILKTLRVPATDPEQIAQMAPHEIRTLMPWPEEESLWGYRIESCGDDGYATLLVSILQRSNVIEHCECLKAMGIALTHVTLSTLSIQTIAEHLEDDERPAILHIGEGVSEYVRFANRRIAFSRGVNSGTDSTLVLEESMALDARKHGDDAEITSLVTIAEELLDTTPLVSTVPIVSIDNILSVFGSELNGSDALCIGASLGTLEALPSENLLPESAQRVWQRKRLLKSIQYFALSLISLIGILFLLAWYYVDTQQALIESTQLEIQELNNEVGDLKTQTEELQQLSGNLSSVSAPLTIVLELYERTPSQIAINYFRYSESGNIVMGGEAPNMDVVWDLTGALQESSLFVNVKVSHVSQPKVGQAASVDFKISCKVTKL